MTFHKDALQFPMRDQRLLPVLHGKQLVFLERPGYYLLFEIPFGGPEIVDLTPYFASFFIFPWYIVGLESF